MFQNFNVLRTALTGAAVLAVFSRSAWAYVDPNTGSMLLQIILAGVGGLVVVWRIFKDKIRRTIQRFWK